MIKVLELQLHHQSFQLIFRVDFLQDWQVWPFCPRDSQESSQHHSLKASVLRRSAFFMIQLSHPYVTTRKIIALTGRTFVSKVMSLPFNVPSGLSQPFFQGASVFNFMAAVIVLGDSGAQENKNCHCFHCFPVYLPWSDGTGSHDLSFFECLVLSKLFHSPLSPSSSGPLVLLCFCH